MRAALLFSIFCILLLTVFFTHKESVKYNIAKALPNTTSCNNPLDFKLKKLIDEIVKTGAIGGQLSIINNTGVEQHCAFGWEIKKYLPTAVSVDTTFKYASLSKLLTSFTALQLANDKRLALNSSLLSLLDDKYHPNDQRIRDITLKHLLTHKAGFNRYKSGDPMLMSDPWCPNNLARLNTVILDSSPGHTYSYSNLGYCLLGEAIANGANKSLVQLIVDELDLKQYPSIRVAKSGKLAENEANSFFQHPENERNLLQFNYQAMLASGGWSGTTKDLARLLAKQLQQNSSIKQLITETGIVPSCDISQWRLCHGVAFYKYQATNGPIIFWRDGSLPGVTAFALVVESGDIVVFITNYRKLDWMPFNDAIGEVLYNYLK